MKKVLFITPTLGMGGTNSSLSAIFTWLQKQDMMIDVFALTHQGKGLISYTYKNALLKENMFLSAYICNYSETKGLRKLYVFLVKLLKRLSIIIGYDLEGAINRYVVKKIERDSKYDIVVAFQEGATTKFASLFNCKNKIAWIHCDYNRYLPLNKTEESLYVRYNKIVCVSKYTKSVFCRRYPMFARNTIAIHNILDLDRIKQLSTESIEDIRFKNEDFTILSVGRITPIKQFNLIPHIARQLIAKGVKIKWYILGFSSDDNELNTIIENIKKYDVLNIVTWLGNKPNPYPYFIKSDLLVTLSISEACPMIFNEANILKLPIVTTNFGSADEFIQNGLNGTISTVENITSEIEKMILDIDYYTTIKENLSDFNIDNQIIYNNLNSLFCDSL